MKAKVAILMGSETDLPVMREAVEILVEFGIDYELEVMSAHRSPHKVIEYAEGCEGRGIEVIIAGAGGAAHLPGMVAALTNLPVIGVPIKGEGFGGLDSLLSMVQMPSGVPVGVVGVNKAKNAGILAVQILGLKYPEVKEKLKEFKVNLSKCVGAKIKELKSK